MNRPVSPAMKSQKSSAISRWRCGVDPADARGAALVDVAEQAGPADLAGPLEDPGRAGAHREDPQREVEGLADRPGVGVGAEVAGALALGAAHDLRPGVLLAERHREVGVGLVVAVPDVEPRVELLDPRVLELEGLDLGGDDGPLDAGAGAHHGGGAVVQRRDVLEVGGQPLPQALGLADVDDPPVLVAEPVDAGVGRDLTRPRTVRRRVSHAATLRPPADTRGRPAAPGPQVTVMPSAPTVTLLVGSGLVAGPCFTSPVAMSKVEPWHGQVMTPFDTPLTVQPWWVQMAENAL